MYHETDLRTQGQTSSGSTASSSDGVSSSTKNNDDDEDEDGETNGVGVNGDDILAALEKIPGVGSLRKSRDSSVGCSLPSLDNGGSKLAVKREESSFSLKSHTDEKVRGV